MVAPGSEVAVCCGADVVDVGVAAELVAVGVGVFVGLEPQAGRTRTTKRRTVPMIFSESGTGRNARVSLAGAFCGSVILDVLSRNLHATEPLCPPLLEKAF